MQKVQIVLFSFLSITFFSFSFLLQYYGNNKVYAQTVENEIIENTIDTIENAVKNRSKIFDNYTNEYKKLQATTLYQSVQPIYETKSSIADVNKKKDNNIIPLEQQIGFAKNQVHNFNIKK